MKRLALALTALCTLWITGCSSGSGTVILPPPTGKYGLSSLKGTYSFSTNGEVFTINATSATQLARLGSFVADGNGNITGGTEDVNAAGIVTPGIMINATGSSYTVNADGRGTLTLSVTSGGTQNTLNFAIVITSTGPIGIGGGLMIDETSTATQASTGSGNFILQDATLCSTPLTSPSGTYVFDFTGLDLNNSVSESIVGEFTANGTPTLTSPAFADVNDGGAVSNGAINGTLAAATLPSPGPDACGRGVAVIGGLNFVYYNVSANRIRFLSNAGGDMLSGDALLQGNLPANLSGGFAFLMGGSDNVSKFGPLTRVGRFTVSGGAITDVLMDSNDAGSFTPTNSGSNTTVFLDAANPGRGTVTFKDPKLPDQFVFVFYLSSATSGVIQDDTLNTPGTAALAIADGTISAQSGGAFSGTNIAGTYALNWSGISVQNGGGFSISDEEDFVGQATIASSALTGAADMFRFQGGAAQTNNLLSGTLTFGGDGTGGDGTTTRNKMNVTLPPAAPGNISFVVYIVNPQLAFFASNGQSSRTVAGILEAQQ